MAMNPRLLRPIASGIDPAVGAWRSAVLAANSSVNGQVVKAVDEFARGCRADGIWDAMTVAVILCGPSSLGGALVPLKGAAPTNNNFVAGDYNRLTGLVGNGSNKFLNTGFLSGSLVLGDAHLAVYVSTANSSGTGAYIGANSGTGAFIARDTADLGCRFFVASTSTLSSAGGSTGLIAADRTASSLNFRAGGSTTTFALSLGTALTNSDPLSVFGRNNNGTTGFYGNGRLAFYSIGKSLDVARLDTRVSALITAIGNS